MAHSLLNCMEREEGQEVSMEILVNDIRDLLSQEREAEELNRARIDLIYELHKKMCRREPNAETMPAKDYRSFLKEHDRVIGWHMPNWLDYGCGGSFFARARDNWFPNYSDEGDCWFGLFCCIPIYMFQAMFGCCCPCGYSDGCCISCDRPSDTLDDDGLKDYLKTLNTLYASPHWQSHKKKNDAR